MRRCATTLEAEMSLEEHGLLLHLLREQSADRTVLEIGTAAGGTLLEMIRSFPEAERPQFVVVDPMTYFPNQLETVRRNLSTHGVDPSTIDFRVTVSTQALESACAAGDRFDFMLIDGCHKVRAVMNDLRWTRLLNVGGIVCFHDYSWEHKGVFLAVNRFLASHPNYEAIGRAGSLLAVRKRASSPRLEVSPADQLYSMLVYLPLQVERKLKKFAPRRSRAA